MTSLVLRLTSDASLRGIIKEDGTHLFSVYDFITIACQKKDDGAYARKTYSNLVKDSCEFKKEVVKSVHYCQFPGARQRETPTMTIRGLQRLLMILGGKVAANFRKEVEGTFTRVMAGDTSLIQEIRDNAVSSSPVHQVFRQALAEEPIYRGIDQNSDVLSLRITNVIRPFPVLIMPPFRAQTGEGGFTGVDIVVCPHEETLFSTFRA